MGGSTPRDLRKLIFPTAKTLITVYPFTPAAIMFKVLALLACVAAASAQTGADSAAASDAVCDEPRSWKIISDINNKGVMCNNVVYDPTAYRCCGKTLRRLASNAVSVPSSLDGNIGQASAPTSLSGVPQACVQAYTQPLCLALADLQVAYSTCIGTATAQD